MKNLVYIFPLLLLFACSDNKDDGGETPPPYYNPVEGIWQFTENGEPINAYDVYTDEFFNYIRRYDDNEILVSERRFPYKIDSDSIWYDYTGQPPYLTEISRKWEIKENYLYLTKTSGQITKTELYIRATSMPE